MSIFSSLLGPAIGVGGLLYGQSQQNKATKKYANQISQPPPSTTGPFGYFSNQSFGFNPQSQATFNAFNKAALDELNNFSSYKGVGDTAYNQLSALTGPTREFELDKLRSTLYGQGRLDLAQYRPSYDAGTQVATNPELQSFYEAMRAQDVENAYQSLILQDNLRNSSVTRAAGLQGGAISLQNALLPYGNASLAQQQQTNLAASEQLKNSLASASNWSSLLTSLGGELFKEVTGEAIPSPTSIAAKGIAKLFGGEGTSPITSSFQSLLGGNPFGNLGSALGLGLPNAGANGIIPSMSALGLSGLSPSASLALSGPLGGAWGQGAAASAAGASGGSAGGALGLTSGLGGLGLLGAGTLGLIGGLGLMTIGGNEKAQWLHHPQGLWSIESFYGGEPTLKPGRAGDEHGRTNPGKPANIGANARFLARPSHRAEAMQRIEAENRAALQLYGADIKTLMQSGRMTQDMMYRLQQMGLGYDPGPNITWEQAVKTKKAKKAERRARQAARSSDRGGGDR